MLSGRRPILMRVRISFDALRLCLLVAAGVTSGYLWRAAFESSSPLEARVAEAPRIVQQPATPPVVRIVPHPAPKIRPAVSRRAVGTGPRRRAGRATTALISAQSSSAGSQPASSPADQPSAEPPTPTPTPTPSPPTPVSAPAQESAPPPSPPAPPQATQPPPQTPPPPTSSGD